MPGTPHLAQRLGQQQQLRQQQLSPQLQLTMQLLPLNSIRLAGYLQQQLNSNPWLSWRGQSSAGSGTGSSTGSSAHDVALATHAAATGLQDHLLWQLRLEPITDELQLCAEIIIDELDRDGYLRSSLNELAEQLGEQAPAQHCWQQALNLIHSFEPTGAGARNLRECLRLQLEQNHPAHPHQALALRLTDQYLDELARLANPALRAHCATQLDCQPADIAAALELIHALNPRPGLMFDDSPNLYIRPDLRFVRGSGHHHNGLPRYAAELVNPFSNQLQLSDSGGNATQRREAQALLAALGLREQSLLRVGQLLAEHQAGFLQQGEAVLRPLTRVQVAEQLGLHPSTVTRALQDKYADTPQGLLPLKDFFSVPLSASKTTPVRAGESTEPRSAGAARARLAALISNEDPQQPLSDARLCRRLQQAGFAVARRTVVKYRQQLGIENSRKRREL